MPTSNPTTFSEIIWWGFCFLLVCGVGETLRRLWRIEKKQDDWKENCPKCKEEIMEKMVSREYMNKWEEGRNKPGGLWDVINHHSHEGIPGSGKVIR